MISIPGYQILETIVERRKTSVFRARSERDGKNVIIKTSGEAGFSSVELKRKYEISAEQSIEGIVKIFRMERFDGGNALVMEDFGGVSLEQIMVNGFGGLREQLDIAVKVSDILGRLHGRGIIHGNIKPSNIIVNPRTGEVKLTDMTLSRIFRNDESRLPDMIPATLMYISPEQTGRMNRLPDYRTDFYSLGVTLYEMLTGVLPFKSNDPIELIYSHLARQPQSIESIKPGTPRVITQIVDKLLEKNPEDRYQSAFGIKYDLEKCILTIDGMGRIEDFQIGEKDVSERLNIPRKVYGRENEKSELMKAYERSSQGACEVVLIHGSAGIGKTSLVHEVFRNFALEGAFFIEGKYDKLKQDIPYNAIIQAFRGLIRRLLAESRERLAEWKACLQSALGINGRIILDVIPEVEFIIGPQPPVPPLGPAEAKNVFDMVFKAFFKVFTRAEHPLVMFLDDLQNADTASLKLMDTILADDECRFFLLVGAYRGEEVDAGHPLLKTLDAMKEAHVQMGLYMLEPLGSSEIEALSSDMFASVLEPVVPLTELIRMKTGGNAFFIIEFINKIYREKLLRFNTEKGGWEWELDRIVQLSVTDNIIELLVERLNRQPEDVRETLCLASCIGNTFHASLLAEIRNAPLQDTIDLLLAAVREGFLLPVREIHAVEGAQGETYNFRFLHDRIQEASHALLGARDIRGIHLAIGRAILKSMDPDSSEDLIFEVLAHFGKAIELVTDESEKLAISSLGLAAGKKAGASTAYSQACGFLSVGISVISDHGWEKHYRLMFDLHREMSYFLYLAGELEESDEFFRIAVGKALTDIDRGDISASRVTLFTLTGRHVEAHDIGIEALNMLGISIDGRSETLMPQIGADLMDVQKILAERNIRDVLDMPLVKDPLINSQMKALVEVSVASYFFNPNMFILVILKMLKLSLLHGNTSESSVGYVTFGALQCQNMMMSYTRGFEFGRLAIRLNEKIGNRALDGRLYYMFGTFINHWKQHIETSLPVLDKSHLLGREYGDFLFSAFAAGVAVINRLILGRMNLADVLEECEANIAFSKKVKNVTWVARQRLTRQIILSLMGRTEEGGSFGDVHYNEIEELKKMQSIKYMLGVAHYYLNKAKMLFLLGKYDEALDASEESEKTVSLHNTTFLVTEHYLYQTLILLAPVQSAAEEKKKRFSDLIERNKGLFAKWTESCPENFECRYLLIKAEMERNAANELEAMRLYDRAIMNAEENHHPVMAALANELAALFHRNAGREKVAGVYMKDAIEYYRAWGAEGKVSDIEERYSGLIKKSMKAEAIKTPEAETTLPDDAESGGIASVADLIDLTSIIRASQAISGEILFKNLVDRLMRILIENAGAGKGSLLIEEQDGIVVDAQYNPDGISVSFSPARDHHTESYPESVVNYVKRTEETVVLNDAFSEGMFVTDRYIAEKRPQSILCMPIVEQKKVAGVLYLENSMVGNIFTPERVEILKLLSSQAAISVRNALNFEEIRRTKDELQNSKERLQETLNEYLNLFNNIQDAFYRTNTEGNLVLVSPSAERLLGYTTDEILKLNITELYRYPEQREIMLAGIQKCGLIEDFETELVRKDGSCIWVSSSSHFYRDKSGKILGVEGIVRDITNRKRAEDSLRSSLEEKEILLKELYHRTKNNMQVICSLLNLKSDDIRDETAKSVVVDIESKIKTMALVHQKLYEARDLSNINLRDYMAGIVDLIGNNSELQPGKIAFHQVVEDIPISIDTAIPLGLVINELIMNSMKHAFPGGRSGSIRLQAGRSENAIIVDYQDDGIGLPKDYDPDTASTLGITLITVIVQKQLGGEIMIRGGAGFGCTLTIKTRLYKKRM